FCVMCYYVCVGCDSALILFLFTFHTTSTTCFYTLSLHDALPIFGFVGELHPLVSGAWGIERTAAFAIDLGNLAAEAPEVDRESGDRKSTRLNSSHGSISYAVFCLKK